LLVLFGGGLRHHAGDAAQPDFNVIFGKKFSPEDADLLALAD
jgi:hypothetical protein